MTTTLLRCLPDDAEIVRDEQHRHSELFLEVVDQLQDLRLHGHVERGRRLVGDQQAWPTCECCRNHHPLAHAARQIVRILIDPLLRRRNADTVRAAQSRARAPRDSRQLRVQPERLRDLPADRKTGLSAIIGS